MKCPTCGSEVPEILAKCADCGEKTKQPELGKPVYCGSCGGKRKAKQRAKALRQAQDKAARAAANKAVKPVEDKGA